MADTAGSIIDKINVIELKVFHSREQLALPRLDPEKKRFIEHKIQVLNEQKRDLAEELDLLMKDILSGAKELKVYRQFKVYGKQ